MKGLVWDVHASVCVCFSVGQLDDVFNLTFEAVTRGESENSYMLPWHDQI